MHACHRTIIATLLMLALQLVALSSGAFAQRPLDYPGAVNTTAYGINAAGTFIVGGYTDTSGTIHGFAWQGGTFTGLNIRGAAGTTVYGINAAGSFIVGNYVDTSGTGHGFLGIR